jgi:hypothetical protein
VADLSKCDAVYRGKCCRIVLAFRKSSSGALLRFQGVVLYSSFELTPSSQVAFKPFSGLLKALALLRRSAVVLFCKAVFSSRKSCSSSSFAAAALVNLYSFFIWSQLLRALVRLLELQVQKHRDRDDSLKTHLAEAQSSGVGASWLMLRTARRSGRWLAVVSLHE